MTENPQREDEVTANEPTMTVVLVLDPDDARAILEQFQVYEPRVLPDGYSNDAGAILAEACRDLEEYRSLFNKQYDAAKAERQRNAHGG